MEYYYYLNFYIYRYYKRKQDVPLISTLLVVALLLHLNVFTIIIIYQFITDFWNTPKLDPNYKIIVIVFLFFLVILNYFLLYHNKKYVKIFDKFKKNIEIYQRWNFFTKLYIVLSILLCLVILIIADLRNHNFELYFLK